eukprot:TRINITY_DN10477_c1_g1_i2.p1 TRINITY_DN10477_c1_g1~~TRINITY_DN10477_c1_g1_i2.p1  ORF type:complete len:174 (-),score=48.61 TRINITY_DN10477_c1_g1_i2:298-819(-)
MSESTTDAQVRRTLGRVKSACSPGNAIKCVQKSFIGGVTDSGEDGVNGRPRRITTGTGTKDPTDSSESERSTDIEETTQLAMELRKMRVQYNELKARHEAMSKGKGTPVEIQLIAVRAQKEKLELQLEEHKKALLEFKNKTEDSHVKKDSVPSEEEVQFKNSQVSSFLEGEGA